MKSSYEIIIYKPIKFEIDFDKLYDVIYEDYIIENNEPKSIYDLINSFENNIEFYLKAYGYDNNDDTYCLSDNRYKRQIDKFIEQFEKYLLMTRKNLSR